MDVSLFKSKLIWLKCILHPLYNPYFIFKLTKNKYIFLNNMFTAAGCGYVIYGKKYSKLLKFTSLLLCTSQTNITFINCIICSLFIVLIDLIVFCYLNKLISLLVIRINYSIRCTFKVCLLFL